MPTLSSGTKPHILEMRFKVDGMDDNSKIKEGGESTRPKEQENAAANLWKSSVSDHDFIKDDAIARKAADAVAQQDGYHGAIKTAADAESSWRRAFADGKSAVSQEDIKSRLSDPSLDAHSKGYLRFLQDNFDKLAGLSSTKDKPDGKLNLADLGAAAAMNEISPEHLQSGVKFLQDKFFELSGMDDKVTRDRVEKMYWDHSFKLFPKDTQQNIFDLISVMKSVDQRPENFPQGKRGKTALSDEDAGKLDGKQLADNLRVQALQRWIFGKNAQGFDGTSLGKDALTQYQQASKRYAEKSSALDSILSK